MQVSKNYIGAVLLLLAVFLGFSTTQATINTCKGVVTKYVSAEFSETYINTGIDIEGNFYSSVETDYWSEDASERWTLTTINEPKLNIPEMPPIIYDWSRDTNFDRYEYITNSRVDVFLSNGDYFREPASKYVSCSKRLGDKITVKTWYGNAYSSEEL